MRSRLPILARGDDWVVVAKPSGLAVHRSPMTAADNRFAVQVLRRQLGVRVHPIHRLDRGCSGCLLFGLNPEITRVLQVALAHPASQKTYVALVRSRCKTLDPIDVEGPMKDENDIPKHAHTRVWCLGTSPIPRCSLMAAHPTTGRFHQVRRHLRTVDHPILGDTTHGDTRENRAWRTHWGVRRLQLHCLRLDLALPDGSRLRATCPIPQGLSDLWRQMPYWDAAVERLPLLALPPPQLPPRRATLIEGAGE